jgi:transglutaminase-like putative cysteine protease
MYYTIRHLTKYQYSTMVSESIMQLYMQPRTESASYSSQRCFAFEVSLQPRARVLPYRDYLGNTLHTFTIPSQHLALTIVTRAVVEVQPPPLLPESLPVDTWDVLDTATAGGDYWDALAQTDLTAPTPLLYELAEKIGACRRDDPLTVIQQINTRLYESMSYKAKSTRVDSPIDVALAQRTGVCQDFAQIMISLLRGMGIPARYVSGYMAHRRSDRSAEDATHAWVEAWLPELGWVGFDPTNNSLADDHYIRVAIGRDYDDVPPTRGVFKGGASSALSVAVQVTVVDNPNTIPELAMLPSDAVGHITTAADPAILEADRIQQIQQMQQ